MQRAAGTFPIAYGDEILALVRELHAGSEQLPGYDGWIRDHMGGRVVAFRERLLPQIRAFTDLEHLDILDFGCGTGSSTVVLAEQASGSRIVGADLSAPSLTVARARLRHHGMPDVDLVCIPPVGGGTRLPFTDAAFDFVLLNGVLEHVVPFSARADVILEVWRVLRTDGMMFITETPNVLWPIDRHTTGLPLLPWLPSKVSERIAVAAGKHQRGRSWDVRGWRGMTFWEIVKPLRTAGERYEVLNVTRAGNRISPVRVAAEGRKRRVAARALETLAARPLAAFGVPTLAFWPFIEFLCIRKG
jgi:ubiquinone/menaquinone biosynthesis C-methylase UbiE